MFGALARFRIIVGEGADAGEVVHPAAQQTTCSLSLHKQKHCQVFTTILYTNMAIFDVRAFCTSYLESQRLETAELKASPTQK